MITLDTVKSANGITSTITTQPSIIQPSNTIRATMVGQLVSMATSATNFVFNKELGQPGNNTTYQIKIRNNSVSHNLAVDIVVPEFIRAEPSFILGASEIRIISVTVDETKLTAATKVRVVKNVVSTIKLTVSPLNVIGPVFVSSFLQPLGI